jgi:hypothetical protein
MWIFTRYGFYSVACGRKQNGSIDPEIMMIRARSREHLEALKSRFPVLETAEIVTLHDRDYRWRLLVSKKVWTEIVGELANEQEWSNFKNEVARYQGAGGAAYVDSLHGVWEQMYALQSKKPAH